MTERPKFLPKDVSLGRTSKRQIEQAYNALPLIVQRYIELKTEMDEGSDEVREQGAIRADTLLSAIIVHQPTLHKMTDFFQFRDGLSQGQSAFSRGKDGVLRNKQGMTLQDYLKRR